MFYRRKIILALIQLLGGELEKIRIQKLLFLFNQKLENPEYEFVPYKFGCYSYSANADLITMVKKGIIAENDNNYIKSVPEDYVKSIKPQDKKVLVDVVLTYGKMSSTALIKHSYINFPYWAIKSTIMENVLNTDQILRVNNSKLNSNETVLFTIGYEGFSLENYLNKLIKNDVRLLVDVRKNPLSMKYGFSKTLLRNFCESLGIEYIHIPEVGINSDLRQELNNQNDYDNLFKDYTATTLSATLKYQNQILDLLVEHKRIALTCFEANICQCHRKPLAESIANLPIFDYKVKHL